MQVIQGRAETLEDVAFLSGAAGCDPRGHPGHRLKIADQYGGGRVHAKTLRRGGAYVHIE
jgi:hypothetical protein